jgi:hypothetical protein
MGLVELRPTLIRGNASEVLAVAGELGGGRGVDSTAGPAEALPLGKRLARDAACIVAISGATDLARARPPPAPCVREPVPRGGRSPCWAARQPRSATAQARADSYQYLEQ